MRKDLNARTNPGSVCVRENKDEQIRASSIELIKKSKAGNQSLKQGDEKGAVTDLC